jgi:hypothetical protein
MLGKYISNRWLNWCLKLESSGYRPLQKLMSNDNSSTEKRKTGAKSTGFVFVK